MAKVDPFKQWLITLPANDREEAQDFVMGCCGKKDTMALELSDIVEQNRKLSAKLKELEDIIETETGRLLMKVQKNPMVYRTIKNIEAYEKDLDRAQESLDRARANMREQIMATLEAEIDRRLTNDVRKRDAAARKLQMEQDKLEAMQDEKKIDYIQPPKLYEAKNNVEKVRKSVEAARRKMMLYDEANIQWGRSLEFKEEQAKEREEQERKFQKQQEEEEYQIRVAISQRAQEEEAEYWRKQREQQKAPAPAPAPKPPAKKAVIVRKKPVFVAKAESESESSSDESDED